MKDSCVYTPNIIKEGSFLPDLQNIYETNEVEAQGRYIYFGSKDGYSITYPAYKDPRSDSACAKSDPRTRSAFSSSVKHLMTCFYTVFDEVFHNIQNIIF